MDDRPSPGPDIDSLNDAAAARLLARASQLDSERESRVPLSHLREAAAEAGISAHAFEAAVGELQHSTPTLLQVARARQLRRARVWAVTAVVAITAAAVLAIRGASGDAPLRDEAILLHCLSPEEAAELIRPLLKLPSNTIVMNPERAPHVITLRATSAQLRRVRSALRKADNSDARVCVTPAPNEPQSP